jgi:hypothetical protein
MQTAGTQFKVMDDKLVLMNKCLKNMYNGKLSWNGTMNMKHYINYEGYFESLVLVAIFTLLA